MKKMRAGAAFGLCALLAAGFVSLRAAAADDAPTVRLANFEHHHASHDVRYLANWIVHAGDNHIGDDLKQPFVIIDKKAARVYVFDAAGRLRGAAPALLGRGLGDTALPGIGAKELSAIAPKDRVTPAGRFVSRLGVDTHGQDVLWLDYEGALAMHRVITTNPKERRLQRLSTPTAHDKRISYGCINLPVKFYEKVVHPAFRENQGVVYVLPETKPVDKVFASYDVREHARELLKFQPDPQ